MAEDEIRKRSYTNEALIATGQRLSFPYNVRYFLSTEGIKIDGCAYLLERAGVLLKEEEVSLSKEGVKINISLIITAMDKMSIDRAVEVILERFDQFRRVPSGLGSLCTAK